MWEIEAEDVWAVARQCDPHAKSNEALAALMARHRESLVFADRAIVEAARYVRDLRRALREGDYAEDGLGQLIQGGQRGGGDAGWAPNRPG
jgi:hypothetical protein